MRLDSCSRSLLFVGGGGVAGRSAGCARRVGGRARAAGDAALRRRGRHRRGDATVLEPAAVRRLVASRRPMRAPSRDRVATGWPLRLADRADQRHRAAARRAIPRCCSARPPTPRSAPARRRRRIGKAAVERLDAVIQAYADVLRKAPERRRRRLQLRVRRRRCATRWQRRRARRVAAATRSAEKTERRQRRSADRPDDPWPPGRAARGDRR